MSQSYVRVNPSVMPICFNFAFAMQYGSDEAIMINRMQYFIYYHEMHKTEGHLHDGKYWTYSTVENLRNYFAFWSTWQVRKILQSLIDQGVLITGNHSKNWRNRTAWYTFADYDHFMNPLRESDSRKPWSCKTPPIETPNSPFVENHKSENPPFVENHKSDTMSISTVGPFSRNGPFVENHKSLTIYSHDKTIKEEREEGEQALLAGDAKASHCSGIDFTEDKVADAPTHATACSLKSSLEVEKESIAYSLEVVETCEKAISLFLEKDPEFSKKKVSPLLEEMNAMIKRDNRAPEAILSLLRFALNHPFWGSRLFGPRTNPFKFLRQNFIAMQMQSNNGQKPKLKVNNEEAEAAYLRRVKADRGNVL